jgi:hypothetical protein
MASRESQGLQIAVIAFAMLTIILAITTYVFYAQANTNLLAKESAVKAKADADATVKTVSYRNLALQYVLGDGATKEQVDAAKPATPDVDVDRILANFDADMALYGENVAEAGPRNYRTLPAFLLGAINNKNSSVVTANGLSTEYQKEKDTVQTTEQGRAKTAETAVATAQDDAKSQLEKFTADLDAYTKEKDKLATQLAEKDKVMKKERDDAAKQLAQLQQQIVTLQSTVDGLKEKVKTIEVNRDNIFENPDGRITWVNQKQQLVWINLGRADGLGRQTSFAVFDAQETGVTTAEPKGRVEVVRILEDHLAEARILEDTPRNPILPNDVIHTPAWSPGQAIRFALVGEMDIDGDGVSDRETIRNIITLNGGVIDAELKDNGTRVGSMTVNTRYMVLGEKPTDKTSDTMLKEYRFLLDEVQRYGTEVISVQKLLSQMGWKSESRTVDIGSSGAPGEFRRRTAPGAKPAAGGAAPGAGAGGAAAPAAAPAEDTPAAEPAAAGAAEDPFK